jgi:hypothetical protein
MGLNCVNEVIVNLSELEITLKPQDVQLKSR